MASGANVTPKASLRGDGRGNYSCDIDPAATRQPARLARLVLTRTHTPSRAASLARSGVQSETGDSPVSPRARLVSRPREMCQAWFIQVHFSIGEPEPLSLLNVRYVGVSLRFCINVSSASSIRKRENMIC